MAWVFIGFMPWIIYWSLSGPGLDVAGMGGALIAAVLLNGYRAYIRNPKTLDLVTLGYFAVAFGVTSLAGSDLFITYGGALVYLALAGVAWGSLLAGSPFTYDYAKEDWDKAFWNAPIFIRTNQIITAAWGGIFTLNVILNVAKLGLDFPTSLIAGVVLPLVGVVGGIVFSSWFPRWYPQRAAVRLGGRRIGGIPAGGPAPAGVTGLRLVEFMPLAFDATAAQGLRASLQFHLSGDGGGAGYLEIGSGRCTFHPGEADQPTLVIESPVEVWTAVARGERSGAEALLGGAYTATGDLELLMQLDKIFGGARETQT